MIFSRWFWLSCLSVSIWRSCLLLFVDIVVVVFVVVVVDVFVESLDEQATGTSWVAVEHQVAFILIQQIWERGKQKFYKLGTFFSWILFRERVISFEH